MTRVSVPVDFDLGLPLLGLEVDGQVQLDVGFDWDLTFGLDRTRGFYVTTGKSDEIRLAIEADIPNFSATGKLGSLQVTATDGVDLNNNGTIEANEKTKLVGAVNIDLRDPGVGPGNDNMLTLSEMSSASPATMLSASFLPLRPTGLILFCIFQPLPVKILSSHQLTRI